MARERRFLFAELASTPVRLSGEQARHLVHVLRLGAGAEVVIFDGKGRAVNAVVTRVDGDFVELEVGDGVPGNESPLELTVAVAVPKGNTMSLIVQKLTELGVTTIQPVIADNGEMPADAIVKRLDRWRRIAIESAKQCGRSRLPRVEPPRPFKELAHSGAWLLTPGASALPSSQKVPSSSFVFFVGPEGGWSETELELAEDRELLVFGLGPRTLRTETAAIAATTLIQWLGGDLR